MVMSDDNRSMRVTKDNLGSHINELIHEEETALKHLLMNQDTTLTLNCHHKKHTQKVWCKSWPWSISNSHNGTIKEGLNKALFKVRILKNAFKASPLQVYSFFTGAILADEIKSIITSDADEVVLGGKHQIKEATAMLLLALSNKTVTVLTDDSVEASTSTGAISIFELI